MSDTVTLSREVVESARFIAMAYAASNQKWDYAGKMQDPGGAHACYEALKAALAAPQPVKPADDFDIRGQLTALKCWHRLTESEADDLVVLLQC